MPQYLITTQTDGNHWKVPHSLAVLTDLGGVRGSKHATLILDAGIIKPGFSYAGGQAIHIELPTTLNHLLDEKIIAVGPLTAGSHSQATFPPWARRVILTTPLR